MSSTAAVFLQKTYDLIQSTPSDVAEWSKDGRAFVIKKIKEFESTVLPKYFKHGNFASFSRQLRFYGFDKTKKHDIRIVQDAADGDSCQGWWEFSNANFQRDAPEQMVHIRRKTYSEPSATSSTTSSFEALSEVSNLKRKMSNLQTQLSALTNQISALTSVVQSYCEPDVDEVDMSPKKMKVVASPMSVWSERDDAMFLSDDEIDSGILDALLDFPVLSTPLMAFEL
ncbi:hypothetical protein H310_02458 [Aphanomyces invadans]|uniref:HSF-type DNA-binding domain-containing protein n=1 Tax=Aphanomyces invadans TaxID=157072 RepID=A0A024UQH1_9STRA|nr:hypothetical protein H310_02458 [Aphanomyces invadans]ETW08097.1 hypothetical protein H310_02458 [Aphanomyces invadans]|eukprot:XP_008864190.1 hypothetical protein H310_02458 [Aphanomyces invadans]